MQKKLYNTLVASMTAALLFTGCGSDSSDDNHDGDISKLEVDGKTFIFYNSTTGSQYVVDPDAQVISSLDSNASDNFYMLDKEAGELTYWPDETTGDAKVIMLKSSYEVGDTNVTSQDFEYLGHFHGTDLAAHSASEFDPEVASVKKIATLGRFSDYLRSQELIKEEIQEALSHDGEELCNFYVSHEDHTHFAITKSAKVLFYEEKATGLEKITNQLAVNLSAASSCEVGQSGITSAHNGIYIFLGSTQKLYLIDSHGLDYHEHSAWDLSEFMPSGFSASQMIAFGEEEEGAHDH